MKNLSFLKNVSIYGGLAALSRFASIFTAPIVARVFSVEDYGILDVISTAVSLFATLAAMNLISGVFRHYYEKDPKDQKTLISTSLFFFLIISISITALLILFSSKISLGLFETTGYTNLFILSFIRLHFILTYELNISVVRLQKKSVQYAIISVSDLVLRISYVLALFFADLLTLQNIIFGQVVIQIIVTSTVMFFLRDQYNFKWKKSFFKEITNYSIPQFPAVIINFIILNSLPILITILASTYDNGIFALGRKIALIFGMLITAFRMAYVPITMKFVSTNNKDAVSNFINNSIRLYSLFLIPYIFYVLFSSS